MQEQFDDLIIDNSGKKNKQKALLFKLILFVVIVLIVALAFKIFSAPSSSEKLPQEPSVELSSKDGSLNQFETIPAQVEDLKDDEFGSLSERLSIEHDVPVAEPKAPVAQPSNTPPLANTPANVLAPKAAPAISTPVPAPVVAAPTPAPKATPAPKVVSIPPKTTAPKPSERSVFDSLDINSIKPAVAAPVAPAPKVAAATSANGTYIQVYAGKKLDPKSHEIKLLENLGLQYQIVEGGGLQRVIVGPYSAAEKAQALQFVRSKVKKDAFFYHKK